MKTPLKIIGGAAVVGAGALAVNHVRNKLAVDRAWAATAKPHERRQIGRGVYVDKHGGLYPETHPSVRRSPVAHRTISRKTAAPPVRDENHTRRNVLIGVGGTAAIGAAAYKLRKLAADLDGVTELASMGGGLGRPGSTLAAHWKAANEVFSGPKAVDVFRKTAAAAGHSPGSIEQHLAIHLAADLDGVTELARTPTQLLKTRRVPWQMKKTGYGNEVAIMPVRRTAFAPTMSKEAREAATSHADGPTIMDAVKDARYQIARRMRGVNLARLDALLVTLDSRPRTAQGTFAGGETAGDPAAMTAAYGPVETRPATLKAQMPSPLELMRKMKPKK